MPIIASEIEKRLSGGAANSDPNASLGGAKSSVSIVDATLQNLFDKVTSAEAAAGSVKYRCFYVHDANATLTLEAAKVWISQLTSSTDTEIAIGLGSSAINGTEQTVVDEDTAPTAVTFTTPVTEGTALAIGDIPAGQHKAVWVRRTVNAGAAADNLDNAIITFKGDTAA